MRYIKKYENNSSLKIMVTSDISELIDRLEHLKSFIEDKISDDDIKFFSQINTIHTDIKLLSGKLKYK